MLIKLKVKSNQKKYNLIQKSPDAFDISVKEKPKGGLANEAIIQLISRHFKKPVRMVRIVRGAKSDHKIIEII